jgi:hypothetical protein
MRQKRIEAPARKMRRFARSPWRDFELLGKIAFQGFVAGALQYILD